jgi:hypothetical protein
MHDNLANAGFVRLPQLKLFGSAIQYFYQKPGLLTIEELILDWHSSVAKPWCASQIAPQIFRPSRKDQNTRPHISITLLPYRLYSLRFLSDQNEDEPNYTKKTLTLYVSGIFFLRSKADSNRCSSFCRAVPSHSAIRPWGANLVKKHCQQTLFTKIEQSSFQSAANRPYFPS